MEISTSEADSVHLPFRNVHRLSVSGRLNRQTAAGNPGLKRPLPNGALESLLSAHAFNWLDSKFPCLTAILTVARSPTTLLRRRIAILQYGVKGSFPFSATRNRLDLPLAMLGASTKQKNFGSSHAAHIDSGSR